jgi:hypothetical protein
MSGDEELDAWQRQWRDDTNVPPAVVVRATRDDARYRRFAITELALSALLLAGSAAYALSGAAGAWLVFAGIWGIGVPTLAFTLWNRRGLWRAADASSVAFVALARQRCRRGLAAVRASYVVLAAVVAYNLATFAGLFAPMPGNARAGVVMTLVVAAIYLVVLIVAHRRVRRRLAAYDALARELDL